MTVLRTCAAAAVLLLLASPAAAFSPRPVHRGTTAPHSAVVAKFWNKPAPAAVEVVPAPPVESPAPWRPAVVGAVWVALSVYAFGFAPGMDEVSRAADAELLQTLIKDPAAPSVEPIFRSIFNSLGLVPLMNLAVMWPGGKDQRVPAYTLLAAFAAGYFATAPYLAFREYRPSVGEDEYNGLACKLFESKLFGGAMSIAAGKLLFDAGAAVVDDPAVHLKAVSDLFWSSTFAHVSTLDLTVLSVVYFGTIGEDMRRRGWYSPGKALAFSALPVLGPALYLLARPALVRDSAS